MTEASEHFVDLYFHLLGNQIDVDHGYALYSAISNIVENQDNQWLHESTNVGLLPVRGQYAGNGKLILPKHARFGLRLPASLIPRVLPLAGKQFQIHNDHFRIGVSATHALTPAVSLYANLVTTKNGESESRFDDEIQRQLTALEIKGKSTRGPRRIVKIRDKKVVGYALFVNELTAEESIRIQERGLGGRRKMGCGVFVAREKI